VLVSDGDASGRARARAKKKRSRVTDSKEPAAGVL